MSKFESLKKFALSNEGLNGIKGGVSGEDTETCTEVCASRADCMTDDGKEIPSSIEMDTCDEFWKPGVVRPRTYK